jgi:uncharacterized membrane protein required for colicin V production
LEVLQRLQPLDVLFAVLWAGLIGWGLQTGLVRQLGMLVGMYGSAVLAGSLYQRAGLMLSQAFGAENLLLLDFVGYVGVLVVAFGLIGLMIWRAYPMSRLRAGFGADNAIGAVLAAIWGALLLITLLTILRYFVLVPWHAQESTQQSVRAQIASSQAGPVLEVVAAPLWQLMVPWFPAPVDARL